MSKKLPNSPISLPTSSIPILSTAGVVSVKNAKGEISVQKVKVSRYISGKRPTYAPTRPSSDTEDDSDEEEFLTRRYRQMAAEINSGEHAAAAADDDDEVQVKLESEEDTDDTLGPSSLSSSDARLRRLRIVELGPGSQSRTSGKLGENESENDVDEEEQRHRRHETESEAEDEDEEVDASEVARQRAIVRQRILSKLESEQEVLSKEEDDEVVEKDDSEGESDDEEYTDSEEEEDEDGSVLLKPVFIKREYRTTMKVEENGVTPESAGFKKQERRRETLKILEEDIRNERSRRKTTDDDEHEVVAKAKLSDVNTDDEKEELEFEAWKLRNLKRIKRDQDEREALEKEMLEIRRVRSLSDAQRQEEMKARPKVIVNRAFKGQYKFLQKYYHRGAFYLDQEDELYKRDTSKPTLEDHFDKQEMPKVMQVKNFGRSGRTKYTHLADQDTTTSDSGWTTDTRQVRKFYATQAGGVRPGFDKPTNKQTTATENQTKIRSTRTR